MTKLAGLLVAAAAFAVALYLILARRDLPTGRRGGRLGARFALMISGFVWLLGGCRSPAEKPLPREPQARTGARSAMAGKAKPPKSKASQLEARTEWQQIKKAWLAVSGLKLTSYSALKPSIAALRAANQKLTDRLVAAQLMDKHGAQVLNDIYADRVFHQLRARAATCYDPTALGSKIQMTRSDLEKRLKLIARFVKAGKLQPAVAQKVERGVSRTLEVLLLVKAHWDKGWKGNRKAYLAEESRILALFVGQSYSSVQINGTLKLRPGVPKAMALIKRIYNP